MKKHIFFLLILLLTLNGARVYATEDAEFTFENKNLLKITYLDAFGTGEGSRYQKEKEQFNALAKEVDAYLMSSKERVKVSTTVKIYLKQYARGNRLKVDHQTNSIYVRDLDSTLVKRGMDLLLGISPQLIAAEIQTDKKKFRSFDDVTIALKIKNISDSNVVLVNPGTSRVHNISAQVGVNNNYFVKNQSDFFSNYRDVSVPFDTFETAQEYIPLKPGEIKTYALTLADLIDFHTIPKGLMGTSNTASYYQITLALAGYYPDEIRKLRTKKARNALFLKRFTVTNQIIFRAGVSTKPALPKAYYSVQIKALPLSQSNEGMALYRDLKAKGYLVYSYKDRAKGTWWMRLRVGAFPSIKKAQEFGKEFQAKNGFEYVVMRAVVHIERFQNTFEVITTPSGIWYRDRDTVEEVFRFDSTKIHGSDIIEGSKALISRDGKEIVFTYASRSYTLKLKGAQGRAETERRGDHQSSETAREEERSHHRQMRARIYVQGKEAEARNVDIPVYGTDTLRVRLFDRKISYRNDRKACIAFQLPVEAGETIETITMSLEAYNDDARYLRAIWFELDGIGGYLGVRKIAQGQHRGEGTIRPREQKKWVFDLEDLSVSYKGEESAHINFAEHMKERSTHSLCSWISTYRQYGPESWITMDLAIRLKGKER